MKKIIQRSKEEIEYILKNAPLDELVKFAIEWREEALNKKLSLRDQFAMSALTIPFKNTVCTTEYTRLAEAAYKFADCMLNEREKYLIEDLK